MALPNGSQAGRYPSHLPLTNESVVPTSNLHTAIAGEKNPRGVSLAPLMKPCKKSFICFPHTRNISFPPDSNSVVRTGQKSEV